MYLFFADKTMAELRDISLRSRVPIGVATLPSEFVQHQALHERGAFDVHNVGGGDLVVPGRPFPGLAWSTVDPTGDSAPPSNASSNESLNAYAAAAVSANDTTRGTAPGGSPSNAPLPLHGLRVIDLTMMWAGPFATMRLAEMGADVIKVESPTSWDNIRTLINQPDAEEPWNSAFYFNAYNRAKRSLTLDLAQAEGRALLLRLAEGADVLVENYRADVLDKLGLSVETLHRVNPKLVIVSMAAFGKEGADSTYVGFGPVIEMLSGMASLTGYGDGEPFKTGISICDPIAGTAAAAAVTLGLAQRERTGSGVWIDLAQREVAMTLIGEHFVAAARAEQPIHRGCRDNTFAPQGCYPTTDGHVVISIRSNAEWAVFCGLLDLTLEDTRDTRWRHEHHDDIDTAIAAWTISRHAIAIETQLQGLGIAASAVRTTQSILDDEHLVARGFWEHLHHPKMHAYRQPRPLWHLDDAPERMPRRHSPLFGEHNQEILQGELGLDDNEIAALRAAQVIADAPVNPTVG